MFYSNQKLTNLVENLYMTADHIKGFCIRVVADNLAVAASKAQKLIHFMCQHNVPHNVFICFEQQPNQPSTCLRLFIFPRAHLHENKAAAPFNVAFCEIAGYVPVGCKSARPPAICLIILKVIELCTLTFCRSRIVRGLDRRGYDSTNWRCTWQARPLGGDF